MRFLRATVFFAAVTVVVAALLWLADVAFTADETEAWDGYPANWTRAQYDIFTACVGTGIIDVRGAVPTPAIVETCRAALRLPVPQRTQE